MAAFRSKMIMQRDGVNLGPGEYQMTMQRPEGTRTYWVYVPQNATQSNIPLLFAFHGLGDDCYDFGHNTGFIPLADQYGFILVYPCGTNQILVGPAWNAGTCCLDPSTVDDVEFTRLMIANVTATFPQIDTSNVFVSGFSNGAFMAEILACEIPDLIHAAAGVSGCVELLPGNAGGLAVCDSDYAAKNKPVSVLHIHGDFDFVVPWTGDALLGFPPTPTDFAAWAARNKCSGQPVQTFSNGPYTNQIYQTCNANTLIELVKHEGGGHEWPVDQYFNTPNYIWSWFSKLL
jgi:polyhydroxybutyrate depolymerase